VNQRRPHQRTGDLALGVAAFVFVFLIIATVTGSPAYGVACASASTVTLTVTAARARRRAGVARRRILREARDHVHRRDQRIDRIIARRWPAPSDHRTGRPR
jgi:uncharacterized protein (DUF2141 family)